MRRDRQAGAHAHEPGVWAASWRPAFAWNRPISVLQIYDRVPTPACGDFL